MLTQFTTHCDNNDLLPDYQSAYRENFSCETALIKLTDDILWSMEEQRVTAVVAIDLTATFDTVDHSILLEVLQKRFGIEDTALLSLQVNVGSEFSLEQQLHFSVPQGSGAGPGLYSSYASMMKSIVPHNIDIHRYADDHALKKSFSAASRLDEYDTIQALMDVIKVIKQWMDQNRLKMNDEKTDFIIFGPRQQLAWLVTMDINVNGVIVSKSSYIKYLGADLDERMSLKAMIN